MPRNTFVRDNQIGSRADDAVSRPRWTARSARQRKKPAPKTLPRIASAGPPIPNRGTIAQQHSLRHGYIGNSGKLIDDVSLRRSSGQIIEEYFVPTAFAGFPEEMVRFFRSLKRNNRREWFQPRKHLFEQQVKTPMLELVGAINARARQVRAGVCHGAEERDFSHLSRHALQRRQDTLQDAYRGVLFAPRQRAAGHRRLLFQHLSRGDRSRCRHLASGSRCDAY